MNFIQIIRFVILWYCLSHRLYRRARDLLLTKKHIIISHDGVIKWKHFPRYCPSVRGIHRSPANSSHKDQWRGALMFSLICAWIHGWVNNREAGDLGRHRAHYDVILTHWGRVTHICVSKLITIGSDNGLSPGRRQAIIWTNAGILLIGTLGTNFSEILSEIHIFSFKEMHLKMSSGRWRPFCLGLNELITVFRYGLVVCLMRYQAIIITNVHL